MNNARMKHLQQKNKESKLHHKHAPAGNPNARVAWHTGEISTNMRHERPQRYSAYPNLGNQSLHNTMMRVTEQMSGPGNAQAKIHRLRRPMGAVQSFVFRQPFCFSTRKPKKNQKPLGGSVRRALIPLICLGSDWDDGVAPSPHPTHQRHPTDRPADVPRKGPIQTSPQQRGQGITDATSILKQRSSTI